MEFSAGLAEQEQRAGHHELNVVRVRDGGENDGRGEGGFHAGVGMRQLTGPG